MEGKLWKIHLWAQERQGEAADLAAEFYKEFLEITQGEAGNYAKDGLTACAAWKNYKTSLDAADQMAAFIRSLEIINEGR